MKKSIYIWPFQKIEHKNGWELSQKLYKPVKSLMLVCVIIFFSITLIAYDFSPENIRCRNYIMGYQFKCRVDVSRSLPDEFLLIVYNISLFILVWITIAILNTLYYNGYASSRGGLTPLNQLNRLSRILNKVFIIFLDIILVLFAIGGLTLFLVQNIL
jgi:hypothetical protein